MKLFNKWMFMFLIISIVVSFSVGCYDRNIRPAEAQVSLSSLSGESTSKKQSSNLDTSSVIQNKAFAHLVFEADIAYITAGFTHPDDTEEEVRIECFMYAWNEGEGQVLLQHYVQDANHYVEVSAQLSVPENDYYLLQCKNKIWDPDRGWIAIITSDSRFSRIAPRNGIGERTGEVTSTSAVLHTYLTEKPAFDATEPDNLRVPPMGGYAQFTVYRDPDLQELVSTSGFYPVDDYIQVDGEWRRINYNFRWTVTGLEAATEYYYRVETMSSDGLNTRPASNVNTFKTAPEKEANQPISFVVVTCLDPTNTAYTDPVEAAQRGPKVFDSMLTYGDQPPDFIIMTGDTVYYDGGGEGYSPYVGYYPFSEFIRRWLYWYATYQFENLMYFFQQVPGYWMVDDHDYWQNNINETIPDGWYIFRNVNPTPGSYGTTGEEAASYYSNNPYGSSQGDGSKYWRAIRWGQHVELFIEEGHNHRDEDANLIWGDEQREWLEQQIQESDATFKIIIATTPLLGPVVPDDQFPSVIPDKHVSQKFRAETELFLNNIRDVENVFIVAGDRHFKYHSTINSANYPQLSHFQEFGPGSAAAPPHAIPGGVPDSDFANMIFSDEDVPEGASAGYLRVEITPLENGAEITFKLIRVTQDLDNDVIHQYSFTDTASFNLYIPAVMHR
jgi:phosphodiesterase/alkaline phosphatase D-like protein